LVRLGAARGAQAPAPTATGDHPYRSKNAIAISEMGPATNNLPPTRGSEEVGDGTMSEVRGQPGVSGAHASVRAEGSGAAAGGGGEAAAAGACDEKGRDENSGDGKSRDEKAAGPAAQGASADGGGADAPLALPRVGRWHVLKLPAEAGDKDLLGRRPDELRNCLFGFVSSGRRVHWPNSQRRKTRRPAGRAVD